MEKIELGTPDITQENIDKLGELFPQVLTEVEDSEGRIQRSIDFDALKDLLGDVAEGQRERYQFTWPGKRAAKAEARRPINKTMRPIPGESVNWDTTKNLYVEGDNLEALKILRETYSGTVKMIFIDPPYNTGKDFVYVDNYASTTKDYLSDSADFDEEGGRLVANLESGGRFHSAWASMIFSRLLLAKDLLSSDGVIFIAIDDHEMSNLKKICDEVFGECNLLANLIWDLGTGTTAGHFTRGHEYILCYARNKVVLPNFRNYQKGEVIVHGALKRISDKNPAVEITFPAGFEYEGSDATFSGVLGVSEKEYILSEKMEFKGGKLQNETVIKAGFAMRKQVEDYIAGKEVLDTKGQKVNRFYFNRQGILFYEKEKTVINPRTVLSGIANTKNGTDALAALFGGEKCFDFPKPVELLKYLTRLASDKNSTIVDFFSGSGTMAQAVMELNAEDGGARKFVLVQIPEKTEGDYRDLCEIGEERIRRAGSKIVNTINGANRQLKLDEEPKEVPDIGFRVLRIDSSNFKNVNASSSELVQESLLDMVDNVKEGRTDLDLLFQVLPKFRIPYSAKIDEQILCGKKCFVVEDGQLVACFDSEVGVDTIEAIAKMQPLYAVMRDSSMINDSTYANFEELFRTYSPDTIRRVI